MAGLCFPIFEMLGHPLPVAKGDNRKGKNENKFTFYI